MSNLSGDNLMKMLMSISSQNQAPTLAKNPYIGAPQGGGTVFGALTKGQDASFDGMGAKGADGLPGMQFKPSGKGGAGGSMMGKGG